MLEVVAKMRCDREGCDCSEQVELTETFAFADNSFDDRDVAEKLMDGGWEKDGEDWVCPSCVDKETGDEDDDEEEEDDADEVDEDEAFAASEKELGR